MNDKLAHTSPRRYRTPLEEKGYVSVSNLVGSFWCEQQEALMQQLKKEETRKYKQIQRAISERSENGKEFHRRLRSEIPSLIEPYGKIYDWENWKGEHLIRALNNMSIGLDRLLNGSYTREFPVWGKFEDVYIRGVVDQIEMADGTLTIKEIKTNGNPSEYQEKYGFRHIEVELQLYNYLLDYLVHNTHTVDEILSVYRLNRDDIHHYLPDSRLVSEITDIHVKELVSAKRIEDLIKTILEKIGRLNTNKLSSDCTILLVNPETMENITELKYTYNKNAIVSDLSWALQYQKGLREPEWDPAHPAKCMYCDLRAQCVYNNLINNQSLECAWCGDFTGSGFEMIYHLKTVHDADASTLREILPFCK